MNSLAQAALSAGKSSPASVYAHIANRDVLKSKCGDQFVDDSAEQLMHSPIGSKCKMKVIFGGGRKKLIDQNKKDDQRFYGQRTDGKIFLMIASTSTKTWEKAERTFGTRYIVKF